MAEPAQHVQPDQQQAPPAKRLKTVAAAPLCASNNEMVEPAPHKQPLPHESSLWDKLPAEIQLLVFRFASPLTRHINNLQAFHGKTAATLDEVTKLQLWIDAFKMDWQGDLYLLPLADLTADNGLLLAHSRSMYHRLCEYFPDYTEPSCARYDAYNNTYDRSFTYSYFDSSRLLLIPMRHCWFDLLDFTYPIALARLAIRFSCLDLLKHLDDKFNTLKNWMAHHKPTSRYWYEAIDQAAGNGHLDVIQYLFGRGVTGCTKEAMNAAAAHGHLHVVIWLHENRTEGCTTAAMSLAAGEGHLHVVKWLHKNRTEGCTPWTMEYVARNGHLDIVQFLHESGRQVCTHAALDKAISKGHTDIVRYMHSVGVRT